MKRKRIVIGIGGSGPGAGKDTVATMISSWLVQRTLLSNYITHFAGRLKWILQDEFHLTPEQLRGSTKDVIDRRYGKTPRDLMKMVANWFKNDIDPNWWIKKLDACVRESNAEVVIIPDVRFANEIEYITSFDDHLLIYVNRPPVQIQLPFVEVANHAMNLNHPDVDFIIDNNGDYMVLQSIVYKFAAEYFADDIKR